jgi:hypothetical protein
VVATQQYHRNADEAQFLWGFSDIFSMLHVLLQEAPFLQTELQLTLSAEKTLITHALTGRARFLGYEIGIMESQTKLETIARIPGYPQQTFIV